MEDDAHSIFWRDDEIMRLAIWTVLNCASVFVAEATATASTPSLEDITTAWRERAAARPTMTFRIRPEIAKTIDQLSLFRSHWVPRGESFETSRASTLEISGEAFRFRSFRWPMQDHGLPRTTRESLGLVSGNNGLEFLPALLSRFGDPDHEYKNPQLFLRVMDGEIVRDIWAENDSAYPRVTIASPRERSTAEWALLSTEEHAEHQLDSLQVFAALLAVNPLHPFLTRWAGDARVSITLGRLGVENAVVYLERKDNEGGSIRRFVLDSNAGFTILRYVGNYNGSVTQIDVEYSPELLPIEWTVVVANNASDTPLRAWVRSEVEVTRSGTKRRPIETPAIPRGSWVIDKIGNRQYLALENGDREITEEELRWGLTYSSLATSSPGDARPHRATMSRGPLMGATIAIALGVTVLSLFLFLVACIHRSARRAA